MSGTHYWVPFIGVIVSLLYLFWAKLEIPIIQQRRVKLFVVQPQYSTVMAILIYTRKATGCCFDVHETPKMEKSRKSFAHITAY